MLNDVDVEGLLVIKNFKLLCIVTVGCWCMLFELPFQFTHISGWAFMCGN